MQQNKLLNPNIGKGLDGNVYGMVFNVKGVVINGFLKERSDEKDIGNENILMYGTSIKCIKSNPIEIIGLKTNQNKINRYGANAQVGPAGDLLNINVEDLYNNNSKYVSNVLADAQIMLGKIYNYRKEKGISKEILNTGTTNLTEKIVNWAYNKTSGLKDVMDNNKIEKIYGVDSMAHIMKGNFGLFISGGKNFKIVESNIENIKSYGNNVSNKSKNGAQGGNTIGIMQTASKNIEYISDSVNNISTENTYSISDKFKSINHSCWSSIKSPEIPKMKFNLNEKGQINTLNDKDTRDHSGFSLSISKNGDRIAVGSPYKKPDYKGYVKIYEYNGTKWESMGYILKGEYNDDNSGISVSLNNNGNIVAIGATGNDDNGNNGNNSGHVRVFKFDKDGKKWKQIGQDIDGENEGDFFGRPVVLNYIGYICAAGGTGNDNNGINSGQVRIFKYKEDKWDQLGKKITGLENYEELGWSIAMNEEGNLIAIGSRYSGKVKIYGYDHEKNVWFKKGVINSNNSDKEFGFSLSFGENGKTLAVGAPFSNGSAGIVRVYEHDIEYIWKQIGRDISIRDKNFQLGYSLSLSNDCKILAVGARNSGTFYLYHYDKFENIWKEINTNMITDKKNLAGWSIVISDDTSTVAIGIPGKNNKKGSVHIYNIDTDTK